MFPENSFAIGGKLGILTLECQFPRIIFRDMGIKASEYMYF